MSSPSNLRIPLLESVDESGPVQARYLSALDNNSPRNGDGPPTIIDSRSRQLLESLAKGPPPKQKRRNRTVPRKVAPGTGTGTIYASAIGEAIDIALIEKKWQEKRDEISAKPVSAAGWLSQPLLSDDLVETAISIEKQVSYWKIFDGLDCFVFAFGCIVCWDVSEQQLEVLEQRIQNFVSKPVREIKRDKVVYTSAERRIMEATQEAEEILARTASQHDGSRSADEAHIDIPKLKPKIIYGNIQLTSSNSFEKLAYSYGIAQSVRLDVFEDDVAEAISATSQIPVHLAQQGTVGMSNRALSIKMGQLFLQRSNVNLHWDILDTPELFWEFDEYEQMYIIGRGYLDIDKRIEILNQRLDIMKDLFEMLQNELNVKHSTKIEVIIIVLILAEVILQVLGIVMNWIAS
jgi:uncharacterized Rmd1/YagE family protein